MGGSRLVCFRTVARAGAPVAFLAAVTIAVLVVRSGLTGADSQARPAHRGKAGVAAALRPPRAKHARIVRTDAAYYRIQSGDTLDAVARRFATSVDELLRLNPGVEPTALHVGQRVRVH